MGLGPCQGACRRTVGQAAQQQTVGVARQARYDHGEPD